MKSNDFPKISLDRLLAMPQGTVVEPIPPAERNKNYLRGASLGTLAVNLANGVNRINPRNDLLMHVAPDPGPDAYAYTRIHAGALAQSGLPHHFNDAERTELSRIVGRYVGYAPAIVLGIPRDNPRLEFAPNENGLVIANEVTFGDLDPDSQKAMSDIFGLDVSQLPHTPGAQGPDFAPPRMPGLGG